MSHPSTEDHNIIWALRVSLAVWSPIMHPGSKAAMGAARHRGGTDPQHHNLMHSLVSIVQGQQALNMVYSLSIEQPVRRGNTSWLAAAADCATIIMMTSQAAAPCLTAGMEDLLRVITTPDKGGPDGEEGIFDSEDEASEEEEDPRKAGDGEADEDSDGDNEEAAAAIDAAAAAARPAGAAGDEVSG